VAHGLALADPVRARRLVAFYAITAGVILIPGWRGSPVEMPGGETIFLPPTPEPPRKCWRITVERR